MSLWFTLEEILPHAGAMLPASMAGLAEHAQREGWRQNPRFYRVRFGRGGGYEYHYTLLPISVQASLGVGLSTETDERAQPVEPRSNALWQQFERASESEKQRARERLDAVVAVERMGNATERSIAIAVTARERKLSPSSLWRWLGICAAVPKADRLPALLEKRGGGAKPADIDARAWDFIKADYLRPESTRFAACYRRLTAAAAQHGWSPVPSQKTLQRKLEKEFPKTVRDLARKGKDAAARIYPHQTRDRSHFGPLEAMNADGHKFDVFVRFEDGGIGRPHMVAFQDLRSGVIVGHRIEQSFNQELVRLTFADVITRYAIPDKLWLDNGREFANKALTGGLAHRFRFKIKPEDPKGLFTSLVGDVHFTTPYHGQAKPIERAFRDLAEDIAKHPQFAGAYTGHKPDAKPENYASRAVPIELFREVVAREIEQHNNRKGRRGRGMDGRSFADVLQEALNSATLPPRRATAEQRRLLLLAAEGVTARAPTGEIHLQGNRYWHEALPDYMGRTVIVRFDPQQLKAPLAIYEPGGKFICEAECIAETGFDDIASARDHAKRKRDFLRAQKNYLEADRRLSIDDAAALQPAPAVSEPQPPKVVRLVTNGAPRMDVRDIADLEDFGKGLALLQSGVLPFRKKSAGDEPGADQ